MESLRQNLINIAINKHGKSKKEAEMLVDEFDKYMQEKSIKEATCDCKGLTASYIDYKSDKRICKVCNKIKE